MPSLDAERLDVGPDRFGYPQPVERQQRDQGVLGGGAEPGGDEQRPTSLRSRPMAWDS